MWWVSSLLSLVTTPKPHHSEPLICIHGWLTAGAPFPLECSTWGEVHEHTSHISAPGWIQRWVEKGPVWIQPFPSNLHFDGNPFFIRQVMWNVLESTWLRFYRAVRIWTWSICAIFYFIFFTKIDLKIWVWHRYISKIYNYNLFRLNQSQSQSSFTPNRITKKIMFWVKTTNKADVERFRVPLPQTHLEIWRFAIKYPVVSY